MASADSIRDAKERGSSVFLGRSSVAVSQRNLADISSAGRRRDSTYMETAIAGDECHEFDR
jgi:hypothetical protein